MDVNTTYDANRLRRVVFFTNQDGSYGFREERWSDDPAEQVWLPQLWPKSHCDSLQTAQQEAASRIAWLAGSEQLRSQ